MLSSEIGPEHIGGTFDARCTGKVLGVQRDDNNGWTLVQVDVGETGGSIVEMRFVDSDPLVVSAEVGVPVLNPPPDPIGEDDEGNPIWPPLEPLSDEGPDDVEPTPEAGE